MFNKSVPFIFLRINFRPNYGNRSTGSLRCHLSPLCPRSNLSESVLRLISSANGGLHSCAGRLRKRFVFSGHYSLKSGVRLGKLFLLKALGRRLQLDRRSDPRGWRENNHLSCKLLRHLIRKFLSLGLHVFLDDFVFRKGKELLYMVLIICAPFELHYSMLI